MASGIVWEACDSLKHYYNLAKEHDDKCKLVPIGLTETHSGLAALVYWLSLRDGYHESNNPVLHSLGWELHDSVVQMIGAAADDEKDFFKATEPSPSHRQLLLCQQGQLKWELQMLPGTMATWAVKQDGVKMKHFQRMTRAVMVGMKDVFDTVNNVIAWPIPLEIAGAFAEVVRAVQQRQAQLSATIPPSLQMRNSIGRAAREKADVEVDAEEPEEENDM